MSIKEFVQKFYKSDAFIDVEVLKDFLHPEIILEWNSTSGLIQMDYKAMLNYAQELSQAYVRSKVRISHIVEEGENVAVRYAHYVKTIENPREEILLALFMTIWQIKDNKLYRGYQMSHIS
ncbi:nuclear transport factor 2 family protein [Flavobacterium agrisoli]|uniref:Nuclear transport factor 2 family protein n=1 Tax=Flavobacterium agrisoli TaxID=2793066 RepID=A0A934UIG7_9FLAO|nr:nuclear transport factor 2 family protein [Flavobacterium agrisoli]MBK0368418.1 nuclear transport factor 2 family protein [Flavobacterium agrisoli]